MDAAEGRSCYRQWLLGSKLVFGIQMLARPSECCSSWDGLRRIRFGVRVRMRGCRLEFCRKRRRTERADESLGPSGVVLRWPIVCCRLRSQPPGEHRVLLPGYESTWVRRCGSTVGLRVGGGGV